MASAWDKTSGCTRFQQTVATIINDPARRVVWLYGHEHRLSMYDDMIDIPLPNGVCNVPIRAYHRCVGNGGFPCPVTILPASARRTGLLYYDDRVYQVSVDEDVSVPIAFNGFTRLTLSADCLTIGYFTISTEAVADQRDGQTQMKLSSAAPTLLLREQYKVKKGNVEREEAARSLDEHLTRVVHVQPLKTLPNTPSDDVVVLELKEAVASAKSAPKDEKGFRTLPLLIHTTDSVVMKGLPEHVKLW